MGTFPVEMRHPKTGGTTFAAGKSSLRVLEANGWKRKPARKPPAPAPAPEPEPEATTEA